MRHKSSHCESKEEPQAQFEFNSTYKPGDYSEIEKYQTVQLIYDEMLSPSKVEIVSDRDEKVSYILQNIFLSDSFIDICQKDYMKR